MGRENWKNAWGTKKKNKKLYGAILIAKVLKHLCAPTFPPSQVLCFSN